MELDYKFAISILALILSVYSLYGNRRIGNLEKKTEIMAELGRVEIMLMKSTREYYEVAKLVAELSPSLRESIEDVIISISETQSSTTELYTFLSRSSFSVYDMEQIRPQIQKIMRRAQDCLDRVIERKQKTQSLLDKYKN